MKIIKTVLTDPVLDEKEGQKLPQEENFENYKRKVNQYIEANKESLAIFKLTHNKPITDVELADLQNVFLRQLGSEDDYKKEFGATPLGILVRNIAGMDKEAVQEAFADFINSQKLNQNQIVFVDKLVEYVRVNGYIKTGDIFDHAPFDKPKSMYDMFEMPQIEEIWQIIDSFSRNALVQDDAV